MSTQEFKVGDIIRNDDYDRLPIGASVTVGLGFAVWTKAPDGLWRDASDVVAADGEIKRFNRTLTYLPEHAEPEDATDAYVEPEPLKEGDWVQVWAQVSQADPDEEGDVHLWAGEKREYSGFYLKPDSPGIIRTDSTPPWVKVEDVEAKAISAIRTALVVDGGMHDDRYTQQTAESLYRAGIRATKDGAS